MQQRRDNDDLVVLLPWEMILGFSTFDDILNVRVVSVDLLEVVTGSVSSEFCSNFLQNILKEQNIYYIPDLKRWKTAATQENMEGIFSRKESSLYYLKRLLQVLRVIRYLPMSIVVAFDTKYGRHCLPLRWNVTTQSSEVVTYSSPQRKTSVHLCLPCNKQPTHLASTSSATPSNNISEHLQLHNEHGQLLDLQSYSSNYVPSMPGDLICPICNEAEALVLSEFSYRCEPGSVDERPSHVQLSWTPLVDGDENGSNEAGVRENQKQVNEEYIQSFPQMVEDMAIPIRSEPISLRRDCKFAISVHCTKCGEFGVFAPAGVCWNQSFCCAERGRTMSDKTLGGVLVRQKCSSTGCSRPVSCPQCAHIRIHQGYPDNNEESPAVVRPSHCDPCKLTFCDEDAWLSNICHHW